ncbi:MAG: cation:proton antiporter [Candidatus Omnitrophica bacterium]|nr:cation:proton antiporter [Candidatus Omnitrophota bacterium]
MDQVPLFTDLFLVLGLATLVAVVLERFRLPTIIGFLLAGLAMGPHGFGLLPDVDRIHHVAELGVALLMLTIGLELSFDRLKGMGRVAVLGGGLQLVLSNLIGMGFAYWKGWPLFQGFLLGSMIALSSTAIVLKYLIDRGETDAVHGRMAVAILIFQDLAIVPLMILAGAGSGNGGIFEELLTPIAKALVFLLAIILASKYVLPWVLRQVALHRSREIFFLSGVALCLVTMWAGEKMGLSIAIGAFFAGLMFANSDYSHQLLGDITPFRHLFVSFFFVSLGILFDIHFALENIWLILRVVGLVLLVNFVLMSVLLTVLGYAPRIALTVGIILSQVGEFSFLFLETARSSGAVGPRLYQVLISCAFITMCMTPILFAMVTPISRFAQRRPRMGLPPTQWGPDQGVSGALREHIILCGFGPTGQDMSSAFQEEKIPFVLVEMNPRQIAKARERRVRVIYGDAANREVMHKAGIERAKAVVVSFGDPVGMAQMIRVVEALNPGILLVVRTRFERDAARLYGLGADIVIVEEWEASFELHRTVLAALQVPPEHINRHLERIRTRKELIVEDSILNTESN